MSAASLEIPIFGPGSCAAAIAAGARRLELNAAGSYPLGGTTPSYEELAATMEQVPESVTVRIMIRPRGPPSSGPDFIYSPEEFTAMKSAIVAFKKSAVTRPACEDGFVFGILEPTEAGLRVDIERNTELVNLAAPLKCVFHRAFDDVIARTSDAVDTTRSLWEQGLDDVQRCGFDGILTSGGPGTAPANSEALASIVSYSQGKVEIVVGGGVRSSNVKNLASKLGVQGSSTWFHSSCLTGQSGGEIVDIEEAKNIIKELS